MVVKLNFSHKTKQSKQGSHVVLVLFTFAVCFCFLLVSFSLWKYVKISHEVSVINKNNELAQQKAAQLAQNKAKEKNDKLKQKESLKNEDEAGQLPEITVKAVIKISGDIAACVNIKNVGEGIMLKAGMTFLKKGRVIAIDDKGMKWSWVDKEYYSGF